METVYPSGRLDYSTNCTQTIIPIVYNTGKNYFSRWVKDVHMKKFGGKYILGSIFYILEIEKVMVQI